MTTKRLKERRAYFLDLNSNRRHQKVPDDAENLLMFYNVAILEEAQSIYKRFLETKRTYGEPKCKDTGGFIPKLLIYANVHSLKNTDFITNVEPAIKQELKDIKEFGDVRFPKIIEKYWIREFYEMPKSIRKMLDFHRVRSLEKLRYYLDQELLTLTSDYTNLLNDVHNACIACIE